MKAVIRSLDEAKEYYFREGCYINELSNSSDDALVSIARARVEPGHTTHWHSLAGITERYVILEGRGLVEVGGDLAESVSPGDVVVIPPQVPQRISNKGDQELVFLAICSPRFDDGAYQDLDGESILLE